MLSVEVRKNQLRPSNFYPRFVPSRTSQNVTAIPSRFLMLAKILIDGRTRSLPFLGRLRKLRGLRDPDCRPTIGEGAAVYVDSRRSRC